MSLDLITEGSKDYMKYVLQLSEAKSKSKVKDLNIVDPDLLKNLNTSKNINIPTRKERGKPTQGGGAGGGKGLFQKEKGYDKNVGGSQINPKVLFGVQSSLENLHSRNKEGKLNPSGGMDYITKIAQGSSFIDALDQNMPSLLRFGIGYSKLGDKISMDPTSSGAAAGVNPNTTLVNTGPGGTNVTLGGVQAQLNSMVPGGGTGASKSGQFANKVLEYSKNLAALDPFNPLLGYKIGYDMLGGREIIKRTRELGAAQAAGTESSMGHPSGFGYFGR